MNQALAPKATALMRSENALTLSSRWCLARTNCLSRLNRSHTEPWALRNCCFWLTDLNRPIPIPIPIPIPLSLTLAGL